MRPDKVLQYNTIYYNARLDQTMQGNTGYAQTRHYNIIQYKARQDNTIQYKTTQTKTR